MFVPLNVAVLGGVLALATTVFGQSYSPSQSLKSKNMMVARDEGASPQNTRCADGAKDIPNLRDFGLKVVNLWVSHGDATLIFLPTGEIALVDTGQDFAVKEFLMPFLAQHGIESLDYLILTHYHGDHIAGKIEKDGKTYLGYRWDDNAKRIPVKNFWDNRTFHSGDVLNWGGTKLSVLNSAYDYPISEDENERSLSLIIDYNGFRYGIGGDIYARQQERIMQDQPEEVRVHVYRTNHHLHGSVSEQYLKSADPFLFITSAQEAVYEREAYTVNFRNAVGELRQKKARFIESLLTLENGNVLVWANNENSWGYVCQPSGTQMPLP